MDPQVELVDRGPARTLRLPSAMLLPDWARWRSQLFGFTREPAAIIYDEREFDEEDLPTSHRDLASFIRENDSVHFLQDYNLVISRAVWVPKAAREPEKPLPMHPAILHPPSSERRQRLESACGVARP